jgi:hypothetical protein
VVERDGRRKFVVDSKKLESTPPRRYSLSWPRCDGSRWPRPEAGESLCDGLIWPRRRHAVRVVTV